MVDTDNTQLMKVKVQGPYMQTPQNYLTKVQPWRKYTIREISGFWAKNHEKIGKNREDLNYREI